MALLDDLVDRAIASELFTAPRIEADLAAFLAQQADAVEALARRAADGEFDRVFFVGGGGSLANMQSGQYLMDRWGGPASTALPSYELTWRDPAALDERSLVFLASYSGATEDTLAALRRGARRAERGVRGRALRRGGGRAPRAPPRTAAAQRPSPLSGAGPARW